METDGVGTNWEGPPKLGILADYPLPAEPDKIPWTCFVSEVQEPTT